MGRFDIAEPTIGLGTLPQLLTQARIVSGLTQRQLAEALHMTETQVRRYEGTEHQGVCLARLVEICAVLGLQLELRGAFNSAAPGTVRSRPRTGSGGPAGDGAVAVERILAHAEVGDGVGCAG